MTLGRLVHRFERNEIFSKKVGNREEQLIRVPWYKCQNICLLFSTVLRQKHNKYIQIFGTIEPESETQTDQLMLLMPVVTVMTVMPLVSMVTMSVVMGVRHCLNDRALKLELDCFVFVSGDFNKGFNTELFCRIM